jgi:hypothetical protein
MPCFHARRSSNAVARAMIATRGSKRLLAELAQGLPA